MSKGGQVTAISNLLEMGVQCITVCVSFDEKINDFHASMFHSELDNYWSVFGQHLRG
jgi:hypothetical protein